MADKDDVASITALIGAHGTTRIYELSDGSYQERAGGSAAWRHNNPGNLKMEYAGSADTVHSGRSKERALHDARSRYPGAIDLDQHGNVVFDTVANGRAAQIALIKHHQSQTVAEMIGEYSKADYSGPTHHARQLATIYSVGDKEGADLRDKTIGEMSDKEIAALAEGISKFEGWTPGQTRVLTAQQATELAAHPQRHHVDAQARAPQPRATAGHHAAVLRPGAHGDEVAAVQRQLHDLGYTNEFGGPLTVDKQYGAQTEAAVKAFQASRGLIADGRVGPATRAALGLELVAHQRSAEEISPAAASGRMTNPFGNPSHPQHGLYTELKGYLPQASDERLAQFTAACCSHGIRAGGLQSITMPNDSTIAFRGQGLLAGAVAVDISAAAPSIQQSEQQAQAQGQQPSQQPALHINTQMQHAPISSGAPR